MQSRHLLLAALSATLLLASHSSLAKELYKWTDENGVVQYTDTKPTGVEYESRPVTNDPKSAPTTTSEAESAPSDADSGEPAASPKRYAADSAECEQTRQGLRILRGVGPVTLDTDGDGVEDTLTDEQRQASIDRFEDWAERNCEG